MRIDIGEGHERKQSRTLEQDGDYDCVVSERHIRHLTTKRRYLNSLE